MLYLVFNEGYSGDVDLAAEAIRLARQLAVMSEHEEVAGLLALMLPHHARRPARIRPDGSLVTLAEQDRSREGAAPECQRWVPTTRLGVRSDSDMAQFRISSSTTLQTRRCSSLIRLDQ